MNGQQIGERVVIAGVALLLLGTALMFSAAIYALVTNTLHENLWMCAAAFLVGMLGAVLVFIGFGVHVASSPPEDVDAAFRKMGWK